MTGTNNVNDEMILRCSFLPSPPPLYLWRVSLKDITEDKYYCVWHTKTKYQQPSYIDFDTDTPLISRENRNSLCHTHAIRHRARGDSCTSVTDHGIEIEKGWRMTMADYHREQHTFSIVRCSGSVESTHVHTHTHVNLYIHTRKHTHTKYLQAILRLHVN